MNLIIPMAGRGTRLRPHTLTTPKPLVPVAGIPIIERLIRDLTGGVESPFDEIAFVIRDLDEEMIDSLKKIARDLGSRARFYTQAEPLGPAHAIYCAGESLEGPCMIAFADTLFKADFNFSMKEDGVIWVKQVEDPSSYGVVKVDAYNTITDFAEKPPTFVSDLAIVGIYYFREGGKLREQISDMIARNEKDKGEFQITTALENLRAGGWNFKTALIDEWLDCGNKAALIQANRRILQWDGNNRISNEAEIINSELIAPCIIGAGTVIRNSVVGPYVTIGQRVEIDRVLVENSIIQNDSSISGVNIKNSLIGRQVECKGNASELDLGDYSNFSS